jgi:hypothetical protein
MRTLEQGPRWVGLVGMVLGLVILGAWPVAAQDEPQVTWQAYDVTVEVLPDGALRVTEDIVIEFNGSFRQGHRTIPMDRIEEISGVEVAVGRDRESLQQASEEPARYSGAAGTFQAYRDGGDFVIDYGFPQTSSNNSDRVRAVTISYTAIGAIRDYPAAHPPEQQVRWTAISRDVTETGPVGAGSATIVLPEAVAQERLAIDPGPTSVEGDRVIWERQDLGSGDVLQVALAFPRMTDATAPAWQADADRYEGRQQHLPAISMLIGMVALVAWIVTILLMVVRGVRDPEVGLVADIIPQRPDDLPAALVGTLVDESVDTKDVLAGLLDLDRQAYIRIYEDESRKKDQKYRIELLRPIDEAPEWDQPMLVGLFTKSGSVGKDVNLKRRLQALAEKSRSKISKAYEQELFARGYFAEEPSTTRMRWVRNLLLLSLPFGILIGLVSWWAMTFSGWMAVPLTIVGFGLVVGLILTTKAAVKSTDGAVETAKWKAYGRYVEQLRKGPEPEKFFQMLEQDLPWAVALGFDSSWTNLADEMSSRPPSDRHAGRGVTPVFVGGFGSDRTRSSTVPSGSGGGEGFGGLQGASSRTLAAIGGGSTGMFALLNEASASFTAGSSSGGSSSGGGFSGSASIGSSGGGGHSFS